jgi:phytoene dehydrogenase-like protein
VLTVRQSCAATLARHPDRFRVTLLERADVAGGQATSIPLDKEKFGADWMNNGVQGGSKVRLPQRSFSRTH